MAAEQLAVLAVAADLDHPAAIAVDGRRADGAHRHLADDDVVARLARSLLGQPEAGDLRHAEGRCGNRRVVERMRVLAGGRLHRDHALLGSLVRQRRAGDDVADRVDAVAARLLVAVDLDQTALVSVDAERREVESLGVGRAAGGDAHVVEPLLTLAPVE